MRRYLKEFLSDKRVIEDNSLTWKLVLNGIILTLRPRSKGHDYDSIWNRERNESPLKTITRSQAREACGDACTAWTAGSRSTGACATATRRSALRSMRSPAKGCDRILFVPLYPQYAAATTATACDAAFRHLMTMRWQPTLRVAPPYHDDPVYIDALASSIREELAKLAVQAGCDPRILPRHPAATISTRAIPITAIAPRPRGCCARRSATTTSSSA